MSTAKSAKKPSWREQFLLWVDDRTALIGGWRGCPVSGRGRVAPWWSLWHTLLATALVVQAVTGLFLFMHYSPSAQTAWESVYYLQYEVTGGWLVRGMHFWAAQVTVALLGLFLVQMIARGAYRAPREFVFWSALAMLLASVGLCLTGDLLAWDQDAYASTSTRVNFVMLLPGIGSTLYKLAVGGPAFGHLTLTRFFALHVGVFAAAIMAVFAIHLWLARRAAVSEFKSAPVAAAKSRCACCKSTGSHAFAAVLLLGVVLAFNYAGLFTGEHAGKHPGDYLGAALGAPADRDPANVYKAARPEWSFRGLYGFANVFPGEWKIVPVFVVPGICMLLVVLMPILAYRSVGHAWNLLVLAVVGLGLVAFSGLSWYHDYEDKDYWKDLAAGEKETHRVKELARGPDGIPVTGALSLLRADAKTQGPKLFNQQCVACHNYTAPDGAKLATDKPSAPDLTGYGTRDWIAGFLDPERIKSPQYFGDTRFATSLMVRYVEDKFSKLPKAELDQAREAILSAMVADSGMGDPAAAPANPELIETGRQLIVTHCSGCHQYRGVGPERGAPDLTAYASREWTLGILSDPAHSSFYGPRNDRMPTYVEAPALPEKNRLAPEQVALVTDWLRGDWYEPGKAATKKEGAEPPAPKPPVLLTLGAWEARRLPQPQPAADDPLAAGRLLYESEHCGLCHAYTGRPGGDIVPIAPCAPDLGGFASQEWIAGLLDPKQIGGPKYFGNTAFKDGDMVSFVKDSIRDLREEIGDEEFDKLVAGLAAEAEREPNAEGKLDPPDEETMTLLEDFTCTGCHKFHGQGEAMGPDLTGYGSREWLVGIMSDPEARRFYGKNNDAMPSYRAFPPQEAHRNLLDEAKLNQLADFLRGAP